MVSYKKGGRTVELSLPFTHDGKRVRAISFGPVRLRHLLQWQRGDFDSVLALMSDIAGVPVDLITQIAYPDVELVMRVFMDMLPSGLRTAIGDAASIDGRPEPKAEASPAAEQASPLPEPDAETAAMLHIDDDGELPADSTYRNPEAPPDQQFELDVGPPQTPEDPFGIGVDLNG